MANGAKLNTLQNGYLGFLIFFDFDAQNSKYHFKKITAYKIQNFHVIHETGIVVIEIHANNMNTKFQSNIFVFDSAMTKEPGRNYDVTFLKSSF